MGESDRDWDEFDPEEREEREIGREMVSKSTGLGSVVAHFYRGEMSVVTTWRGRLDETINWAVTIIAAVLVYAFSTEGNHVILLTGMVVITMFLAIEARRYQAYDVYRARARLLQENLFANTLDPSQGVEHRNWRRELSEDYRNPTIKTPYTEALARRLRRIYLPFLLLMLAAWLFKLTAFSTRPVIEAARVGSVPGFVVFGIVGTFYAIVVAIAFWPRERHSKGEFGTVERGEWKESD
ncbi:DUF2270 domain-containing protein [Halococcus saccharolyticus]|uniref:DUF2270 domain-containing protein n=1 Tax=Halococcus saccharolyticus DSM 5350 TaxID=1227455 RepID=M0MJ67_9EURY|nr:DUF2270 domain-containing protein [Halococcus saccharolyticus]EMA45398.1 hypothetical protein C449_07225 [Halococcus saccharolyticus DSM 5350]